ncbi:hypothetical protein ACO229_01430 [Promicromonospora sp. MS192]|uniref:hypothetical protein n=2 Tax=unclassified Promicromonospora TaxID=2647929 RepID=UPI003C2EBEDE
MNETGIILARHHDREALRRALRDERMEKIRRGAYRGKRPASADRYRDATERATARVLAVSSQLRGAVVSHESAALLHGLRLWQLPERVHVVQAYRASSASALDIARHRLTLGEHERTVVGAASVTSLARTVADCCLSLHPLLALVIADHARALGADLAAARESVVGRRDPRGRRRALLVLAMADAGAESAWESWLRYLVLRAGLPRPMTQLRVPTPHGEFRADLGWEQFRLLAEFDGRVKYTQGALGPRHDAGRALFDEKRREDYLRDQRWTVVRVTASDGPATALARIGRHLPPPPDEPPHPRDLPPPPLPRGWR